MARDPMPAVHTERHLGGAPRVMLFDMYHGGHHGQHIRVLADYWTRNRLPGRLDVVVSREFADRFPAMVREADGESVKFHPSDSSVGLRAKEGRLSVLQNDLRMGSLLRRSVLRLRPDHCILMYFDHLQASLATRLRFRYPVRFSGTYFRPSFYYGARGGRAAGAAGRLEDLQKTTLLKLALRNPHVDTLFTLDPYAVDPIEGLGTSVRVVHLPEPFESNPPVFQPPAETRLRLGVEPHRKVLLLFGSLDPRKGALELLEALRLLPDHLGHRAALVMAGEITGIHGELDTAVDALRRRGAVQVIHLEGFVPDSEMHALFQTAALVLVPYQRHVGSSGIVVRAAAAGVPVLGPRYGMLGELISDRRLGVSVDTTRPAEMARGLAQFLDPSAHYPFDCASARAFAAENTEEAMAATLFQTVLGDAWAN